jgi:hypothetical protein
MSFRGGEIVARVVRALPMVVAQLLRRLLDLVERVAVQGVEQHVLELMHAVFAVATVQVKQGEEHIVSVVATYLAQIIRDNPQFVTWLQATVKR